MEKIKKYQKQDTNNLTNKTHNIKRLLLIIIAIFLAIVTFEANKSYGAEATITNGSVEQTWEYSLSGENATLTKLTSYKISSWNCCAIISRVSENLVYPFAAAASAYSVY